MFQKKSGVSPQNGEAEGLRHCRCSRLREMLIGGETSLEGLGVAERIPGEQTWVAWQLTERSRTDGVDIIRELK